MQYVHFRLHANYTFFYWKIPKSSCRRSILFYNVRAYLPYQTCDHTTFYHESGLTWNWMLNGSLYIMFGICTYCIFPLYGSNIEYELFLMKFLWIHTLTTWVDIFSWSLLSGIQQAVMPRVSTIIIYCVSKASNRWPENKTNSEYTA